MSQKNINFGGYPDDPNADSLRTAFQKVDQNFTELYEAGVSNVVRTITVNAGITKSGSSDVVLGIKLSQVEDNIVQLKPDGIYASAQSWASSNW